MISSLKKYLFLAATAFALLAPIAFASVPAHAAPDPPAQIQTPKPTPVSLASQSDLVKLVVNIVRFVSAGVGVVIVTMMAYSGFRYLSAGDNPNQVAESKNQMFNVIIALLLYVFGLALINWLVPGGLI